MQALPLKYRPEKFEDIVGQEVPVLFLSKLIQLKQSRQILLHGEYGASKTTSARIYARALNCLQATEYGSPCNTCDNCNLFMNGQYTDYLEFDGASRGKIDQIRDILEVAKTPPLLGNYRVINIEECQGLSKSAWEALLKTLEEPPPFLTFIFTTTEFNKVKEAIVSRCHPLEVKLLSMELSEKHLIKICEIEGFVYDPTALKIISFVSEGHPRDLLKNLEQVSLMGDVTLENTLAMFKLRYLKNLPKIFKSLFEETPETLFALVNEWEDSVEDKCKLLKSFLMYYYFQSVQKTRVEMNPLFSLIGDTELSTITKVIAEFSKLNDLDPSGVIEELFDKFNSLNANSNIELQMFLTNLHTYVTKFKVAPSKFGEIHIESKVQTETARKTRKRGRQWNKPPVGYGGVKEEPLSPVVYEEVKPAPPTKVFPHTLSGGGFEAKDINDVRITP